MTIEDRRIKAVRGLITATLTTYLALGAHLVAGGELASGFIGLLLVQALATLLCALCAATEYTSAPTMLARVLISVFSSQWVFHRIFATPHSAAHIHSAHAGHHHHGTAVSQGAATDTVQQSTMMHTGDHCMLAMHLLAGTATVALIFYGETLCNRVRKLATLAVSALISFLLSAFAWVFESCPRSLTFPKISTEDRPLVSLGVLHSPTLRRGPPAFV